MQPVFDKVIVVTFFVATAIFALDLLTPAGLAEWMLYFIPMLFTSRSRRRYYPLAFATLCTIFVILGFFYPVTPDSMFDFEMGIQRRLLGAFILGGMALVFIERKRAEGQQRESQERFSSFMDNSSALAWIKDSQFRYIYINRLFEEHLNRRLEEVKGRTDFELWPEHVARAVRAHDEQVMLSKTSLETQESAPDAGGRLRLFLVSKFSFLDAHGEKFLGGVATDITAYKKFEEDLHNSELRFRSVWDNSVDGMRLTDSKGIIVAANKAYCRMSGMTEADLVGKPLSVAYDCDHEEVMRVYRERFASRTIPPMIEHEIEFRTGNRIDAEFANTILELAGQPPLCLGLFRDISARKKHEQERMQLERKVLDGQKLESLGVLAGGIAHDFNNLLTGVLGNASLSLMQTSKDSPIRSHLESIEKICQQAADLCKQMLAYSGRGRFVVQLLDLNELVQEMTQLLKISVAKNVVLKFDLAEPIPAIEADAAQIRQILMNLVINASEAIGDKPGEIIVRTGVVQADSNYLAEPYFEPDPRAGKYVLLEVSDNGVGMSAATKAKIFEPFFSTKFTGRGLGLAAVLGIVRGHRGVLKVSSELGRGTNFRLLLPGSENKTMQPPTQPTPAANWRGTGTVLVVDDEESVRMIASRMLQLFGFSVLLAEDGRKGIELFRENQDKIVAVILDMTMPYMSGDDAFREIRGIRSDARVLVISGYNEQDALDKFEGKGLAGFLQKPFTPIELRDKLRAILEFNDKAVQ